MGIRLHVCRTRSISIIVSVLHCNTLFFWYIKRGLGKTVDKGGEDVEQFFCKTKIISGTNVLHSLKELCCKRLMVVGDPYFQQNGTLDQVVALVQPSESCIYTGVEPDPSAQAVAKGTAQLKAFAPDTVVALGGGSAIDCAKAMVYFSGLQVFFVAVPTTSGAGSEVTNFAVITHDGVKTPLVDDTLQPDMAILDGVLLQNLPKTLIADAGFDVLAHALEAAVAKNGGGISGALAQWAFATGCEMLPRSFEGDLSARIWMHQAATAAAMAFSSAGLGLCHALSHSLGGLYHVPHGRLNAILLPAVVGVNSGWGSYAPIARSGGMGGAADSMAVRNLKSGLISLRKRLRLPSTLAQAGVSAAKLRTDTPAIVRAALADPCCSTNPRPVDEQLIRAVLKEVSGAV